MTATGPVTPARAQPVLITLPAGIDMANADAAGEQLAAAFAAGAVVIADMTGTTFCDSMGVRTLVRACRLAGASGTDLRLLVTSPAVMRVMKILGLDAVLPLYQSLEDALAGRA
jgi:anti-sigma B factor antagonist